MKKSSLKALLAGTVAAGLMSTTAFAADLDVDAVPAKEYVEVGSFKGSILLPGTGISFKVGGYTKGDVIFTLEDFAPGGLSLNELFFAPSGFAGTGGDRLRLHALQSRLNFDARTTTDLGSARAFLELDFAVSDFGNENVSNSFQPRLRHAFAEIGLDNLGGTLLVGQTWTNFGDLGSYANTLDFQGPNGQVFIRQAQVRWTQPISDSLTLSVAAENPEFNAPAAVSGPDAGFDAIPDFSARLAAKTAFGSLSLSGLVRVLEVDNTANPNVAPVAATVGPFNVFDPATGTFVNAAGEAPADAVPGAFFSTDTTIGFGVQFAGAINVGEKDKFRFQVNYGQGIGRYLQIFPSSALVDANGNLEATEAFGVIASYQHFWSDKLQSNLVGGYVTIDDLGDENGVVSNNELDSEIYAALNLIYSPRSNINLGIEGLYGRSESTVDGVNDTVDGFRIQTSLQFSF